MIGHNSSRYSPDSTSPSMTTPKVNNISLREKLQCGVCFGQYNEKERVPKVLDCGHTFCLKCIRTIGERTDDGETGLQKKCPHCQTRVKFFSTKSEARDFPTNYAIFTLLNDPDEGSRCESCGDSPRAAMRCCITCHRKRSTNMETHAYVCGNCAIEMHEGHELARIADPRELRIQAKPTIEKLRETRVILHEAFIEICENAKRRKMEVLRRRSEDDETRLEQVILKEDLELLDKEAKSTLDKEKDFLNGLIKHLRPETKGSTLKEKLQNMGKEAEKSGDVRERAKWWRLAARLFRASFSVNDYMDAVRAQWQLVHTLYEQSSQNNHNNKDLCAEIKQYAHEGIELTTTAAEDYKDDPEHQLRMLRNQADYAAWIAQVSPTRSAEHKEFLRRSSEYYEKALAFNTVKAYSEPRLVLMYNCALHHKNELNQLKKAEVICKRALTEAKEALVKDGNHALSNRERELIGMIRRCCPNVASVWTENNNANNGGGGERAGDNFDMDSSSDEE